MTVAIMIAALLASALAGFIGGTWFGAKESALAIYVGQRETIERVRHCLKYLWQSRHDDASALQWYTEGMRRTLDLYPPSKARGAYEAVEK